MALNIMYNHSMQRGAHCLYNILHYISYNVTYLQQILIPIVTL